MSGRKKKKSGKGIRSERKTDECFTMPVTTHSAKPVDSLEGLSSEISFDDFAPTQKVEFNKGRAGEAGDADDEAMN